MVGDDHAPNWRPAKGQGPFSMSACTSSPSPSQAASASTDRSDADHRVPQFAQMAQVAPCAAGNVQHSAVRGDQVAPAPHPFRRGLCTVRTCAYRA